MSRAFLTAKSDETLEGDSLYRAFLTAQPDETLEAKFKVNIAFTLPISDTKFIQFKTWNTNQQPASQTTIWLAEYKTTCLYWVLTIRDKISTSDGIIFKDEPVIILSSMHTEMLKLIHSSHLGIEKCKDWGRDVLFWPGMVSQIQDVVWNCTICNTYERNNIKEPLLLHEISTTQTMEQGQYWLIQTK